MSNEQKKTWINSIQAKIAGYTAIALIIIASIGSIKTAWIENIGEIPSLTVCQAEEEMHDWLQKDSIFKADLREKFRKDSIERINAELYALDFMNRQDSLALVIASQGSIIRRIEAKIDADTQPERDKQIARIWQFLQEKQGADSLRNEILQSLEELKKQNLQKLKNIKSGDRIE